MSKADETLGWSTLLLGTVLREKYRIDRVLGVGGTAVVYAVTHRNRRRFALKLLHPDLSRRPDVRARFAREGYVANTVEHPSIVEVLDDDVDEHGSAFLVMELLDGASVETLTAPPLCTMPAQAALELVDRLLDALACAHEKAVVHRDIKPSNLFLTREGRLKVLDFGVARLRDRAPALKTQTGATLGTPAFMAPEQARSQQSAVDARADIWAVGATLFTLLSGKHVYEGETARDVLLRSATEPPRTLASVMPDAPGELVELVDRALRVDPNERFATAAAMRDAAREVARALHGDGPSGALDAWVAERLPKTPEPPLDRAHSPTELLLTKEPHAASATPRHKWLARGVALATVLVLGAIGAAGLRALLSEGPHSRGIESPTRAAGDAASAAPIATTLPSGPRSTPPSPLSTEGPRRPELAGPPGAPPRTSSRTKPTPTPASPPVRTSASVGERNNPLHLEIQ